MRSLRFFPASVCIRGDATIHDREALDEVNTLLRQALDAGGRPVDRYQLQELDPGQFVLEPEPAPKPRQREWEPPGGLVRPLRPASVIPRPRKRRVKR